MSWREYPEKVPNQYYDNKWKEWAYWKPTGYKYGQYKPWMIKDNGKPLKKNGRKKGTLLKSKVEVSKDAWMIINLMTFWATKITNEENIEFWVKPNTPLWIKRACLELWTTPTSFYHYLNKYPAVKEGYKQMKENRREYMREMSESNIQRALSWKMKKLTQKDVVDYSFKMLERTDQTYNPKQIVETTVEEINPERSTSDIIADISDLLKT